MRDKLFSVVGQPWFWIVAGGGGLLSLLALMPGTPETPVAVSASPLPTSEEKMQQDLRRMREWAVKSNGDFDKVPAEVQGYMNHVSLGHGKEWLRQEAERLKKERAGKSSSTKGK